MTEDELCARSSPGAFICALAATIRLKSHTARGCFRLPQEEEAEQSPNCIRDDLFDTAGVGAHAQRYYFVRTCEHCACASSLRTVLFIVHPPTLAHVLHLRHYRLLEAAVHQHHFIPVNGHGRCARPNRVGAMVCLLVHGI
jgi:hypothetical protein